MANQLHSDLCSEGQVTELELAGTVGKRYKRQDEIGTPICITIDDDTLGPEQLVTLRSRDTRYAFAARCFLDYVFVFETFAIESWIPHSATTVSSYGSCSCSFFCVCDDDSNQRQMPLSELVSKGSKLYKEQF